MTTYTQNRGYSILDWGISPDGTDHTTVIQNAINYVGQNGGGNLWFPTGDFLISGNGLTISTSNVKLVGEGRGAFHDTSPYNPGATRFVWNGATGDSYTMVTCKPASTSVQKLTDIGVKGIELVGTPGYVSGASCGTGLLLCSVQHSDFDIHTVEFSHAGVLFTTMQTNEASNNEGVTLSLHFRQINTAGTALVLGGSAYGNTCFCNFPFIYGYIASGAGIDFGDCDNNTFGQVWIDSSRNLAPGTAGQPKSLVFRGQTNSSGAYPSGGARVNTISHFSGSVHTNLIVSEGTETSNVTMPAYSNRIEYFDNSNASINTVIGTGASFFWNGNLNPPGVLASNLNTYSGFVEMPNGFTMFWGSAGPLSAGTVTTYSTPMPCSVIIAVIPCPLGQVSSSANVQGYGGTSNYRANPNNSQVQMFDLYSPTSQYVRWIGYALA